MTAVVSNGDIIITDTTVYGGANPDRNQVTVDFVVNRVLSGNQNVGVSLPTYDPATVTNLTATDLKDGRHVVTMTITDPITPGTPSTTVTVFRFDDLDAERIKALSDYQCDCCGNGLDYALELKMFQDGIIEQIANNNFQDAQCLLEAIQTRIGDDCS